MKMMRSAIKEDPKFEKPTPEQAIEKLRKAAKSVADSVSVPSPLRTALYNAINNYEWATEE